MGVQVNRHYCVVALETLARLRVELTDAIQDAYGCSRAEAKRRLDSASEWRARHLSTPKLQQKVSRQ